MCFLLKVVAKIMKLINKPRNKDFQLKKLVVIQLEKCFLNFTVKTKADMQFLI